MAWFEGRYWRDMVMLMLMLMLIFFAEGVVNIGDI